MLIACYPKIALTDTTDIDQLSFLHSKSLKKETKLLNLPQSMIMCGIHYLVPHCVIQGVGHTHPV